MATSDPRTTAQELFNMLLNAASSTRRGNGSKKSEQTKEQRDYNKWLKQASNNYKAQDAAAKGKLAREKVIGKQYDDIIKKVSTFGKSIDDAVDKAKSLKELEKIPETVSKIFASSSSAFVKQLSNQAKSLEGLFEIENLANARKSLLAQLSSISDKTKMSVEDYNELTSNAAKAGTSLNSLGIITKGIVTNGHVTKVMLRTTSADLSVLSKETTDLADVMDKSAAVIQTKFNGSIDQFVTNVKEKITQMGSFANVLAGLEAVRTDYEKQREFAAADAGSVQALRLGVTLSQLTDGYVTHRMTLLAMQSANKDVEAEMRQTASTFRDFSRDNDQAVRNLLGAMQVTSKFGVSQEKLTNAVDRQANIYRKSFQPLGLSMEQMNELSIQMAEDLDIRSQMSALNMSERQQMMEAKQARYAEIQAIYGAGRAMEVFRSEQQRAAMKPTERFKTAMYAEPLFATLGMAAQGREYRELMFALPKLKGEEKTRADARLTEIQSQIVNKFDEISATDFAGQGQMVQKAFESVGVSIDSFRVSSTTGTEGQQVNLQLAKDTVQEQRTLNNTVSEILTGIDWIKNAADTSTVKLTLASAASTLAMINVMRGIGAITHDKLDSIRNVLLNQKPGAINNPGTLSPDAEKNKKTKKYGQKVKAGGQLAGVAIGGYTAYDALNTANTPEELGEGVGGGAGVAIGTMVGSVVVGALGTLVGGPLGGVVGASIGQALGGWAGGEIGSLVGKQIAEEISTPSMKEQSAVNTSAAKGEQLNKEILQKITALIEEAKQQKTLTAEQMENLITVQKQLTGTVKAGFNQNTDAVNKQTEEVLKKNIKSSSITLNRKSLNPGGNPES